MAKEVGAPFREILFEDLINDPAGTMSRLGAWLGVGADATRRLADAANATVGPKRAPRPPVRDCVSAATAAPDGSDFRLRNRPAFEAALGALAERAAATGAANGACLRAMPRAPNDQAFPSVISFHDPAARSDCGKKDPKYACVAE